MIYQKFILFLLFSGFSASITFSQNADVYKSDAISLEWNRAYLDAAELYAKAAGLYKEEGVIDTLCLFKAAQNYVWADHFKEAIPFFEQVIELGNYQEGKLWLNYADAFMGLNQYSDAQNILDKGLALSPNDSIPVLAKKARLAYDNGKADDAIAFVNEALAINADDPELWTLKAGALEKAGDYASAADVYKGLLEKDENRKEITLRLGIALFSATESKYKAELDRYKKLSNPSRVDYSNSRKKLNQIARGYNEAIKYLEKSLEENPGQKAVVQRLYISYRRLGNREKEAFYKSKMDQ